MRVALMQHLGQQRDTNRDMHRYSGSDPVLCQDCAEPSGQGQCDKGQARELMLPRVRSFPSASKSAGAGSTQIRVKSWSFAMSCSHVAACIRHPRTQSAWMQRCQYLSGRHPHSREISLSRKRFESGRGLHTRTHTHTHGHTHTHTDTHMGLRSQPVLDGCFLCLLLIFFMLWLQ